MQTLRPRFIELIGLPSYLSCDQNNPVQSGAVATSVIPALERLAEEDPEFKTGLGYRAWLSKNEQIKAILKNPSKGTKSLFYRFLGSQSWEDELSSGLTNLKSQNEMIRSVLSLCQLWACTLLWVLWSHGVCINSTSVCYFTTLCYIKLMVPLSPVPTWAMKKPAVYLCTD